jgi:hypothetical protein
VFTKGILITTTQVVTFISLVSEIRRKSSSTILKGHRITRYLQNLLVSDIETQILNHQAFLRKNNHFLSPQAVERGSAMTPGTQKILSPPFSPGISHGLPPEKELSLFSHPVKKFGFFNPPLLAGKRVVKGASLYPISVEGGLQRNRHKKFELRKEENQPLSLDIDPLPGYQNLPPGFYSSFLLFIQDVLGLNLNTVLGKQRPGKTHQPS